MAASELAQDHKFDGGHAHEQKHHGRDSNKLMTKEGKSNLTQF